MLEVKRFTSRMLGANCYLLHENGEGVIVDPCAKADLVSGYCFSNGINDV